MNWGLKAVFGVQITLMQVAGLFVTIFCMSKSLGSQQKDSVTNDTFRT